MTYQMCFQVFYKPPNFGPKSQEEQLVPPVKSHGSSPAARDCSRRGVVSLMVSTLDISKKQLG